MIADRKSIIKGQAEKACPFIISYILTNYAPCAIIYFGYLCVIGFAI